MCNINPQCGFHTIVDSYSSRTHPFQCNSSVPNRVNFDRLERLEQVVPVKFVVDRNADAHRRLVAVAAAMVVIAIPVLLCFGPMCAFRYGHDRAFHG